MCCPSPRMPSFAAWPVAIAVMLSACDSRSPGPNPDEWGLVTYWELTEASEAFDACLDNAEWRAPFQGAEPLVGSYLTYRVEDGGETATALTCESTEPDSCVPREPPLSFSVNAEAHTLTHTSELRTSNVVGFDCQPGNQTTWTVTDGGEEVDLRLQTEFQLLGSDTACASLHDVFVDLGTNGLGIEDCTIRIDARGENRGVR